MSCNRYGKHSLKDIMLLSHILRFMFSVHSPELPPYRRDFLKSFGFSCFAAFASDITQKLLGIVTNGSANTIPQWLRLPQDWWVHPLESPSCPCSPKHCFIQLAMFNINWVSQSLNHCWPGLNWPFSTS